MIGKTVSHYTIVGRLGHGGMGVVYKAVDTRLQRTVALKFLPPGLADSEESRERLLREARMASTLEHQNICAIHEVDETPDGQVFICMSFYEGQTLSQLEQGGPLPVMEALRIALQVAEGLAHAHSQGVIHRDIKPANIMLTSSGVTKVMDFGLARQEGQERLTRTGTTVGTLAYMAPEQVTGDPADARSDVWSVGVLLFEMLTGRLPFAGDYEAAVAYSIVHEAPRSVKEFHPGVPDVLEAVILRCLARQPADRYASAADLLIALRQAWQALSPPGAAPAPLPAPPKRRRRLPMRSWIHWAAGIIVIAAGMLAIPMVRRSSQDSPPPPPLPTPRKVAVLPFHSTSKDIASRCLAEGFRVFINDRLALAEGEPPGNWTISTVIRRFHGIATAEDAFQQENVNLVMTGELRFEKMAEARLGLSVRDPKTEAVLRQAELKDKISSLSTFQRGLMEDVFRLLELSISPASRQRVTAGGTALPGAFRQYIQGLGALELREEAGSLDMAMSLFRQAVANDPAYADAWSGLAIACYGKSVKDPASRTKWLEEAASVGRQALKISDQAAYHRQMAQIWEAAGRPDEAVREYNRALAAFPQFYDAECDLAWAFFDQNRMKESEEHFLAAIRLRPDFWLAYNYLGSLYNSLARYAEGEKMFMAAIRLAPGNVSPYGNLAAAYFKSGQMEKSREAIDRGLALKPNGVLLSNWGTIFFQGGAFLDAAGLYERALSLGVAPYEYVVWGNLAECYRQLSNHAKAREAFGHAIRIGRQKLEEEPGNYEVRSRLAIYHAMNGQIPQALQHIQAARKLAPVDVDVLVRAVRVYELAGKRETAIRAAQELVDRSQSLQILDNDPDLNDLRKDLRFSALASQSKR